ncbi:ROK family transcriptional regulator [Paenibacillus sp. H1-7]|uniref:ROK family transcriptional regulator n=1 Tax=Paenibacillus sp. H1-7 TaxID=2282849 RepID=UPI001EF7ECAD|nr:ROK family transcriptional regulator [Paenibacillus sp. H1-7]ULL18287.1 ROK family transcriptional regulator [Paenibacillus sp. H1-7]
MSKGTALLRQQNEKRTLALLRAGKHSSRQEIAAALGLSKNTISLIVDKFIKDGVVKEIGADEQGGVGRPRIQLRLQAEAYKSIGILIQHSYFQYVVTDYCQAVLDKGSVPMETDDPEPYIGKLIHLCSELIRQHPEVLGIGIAVPALVDPIEGVVHFSSHLSWRNVRLKERMDSSLPVTTKVLNLVKAAAIAPSSGLPAEHSSNSFYLRMDEGVGGAHIIDSQIYSGASWTAGEAGHLCVEPEGPLCSCGQRGCLEALVSIPAMVRQMQQQHPDVQTEDDLGRYIAEEGTEGSRFQEIMDKSGQYVGMALSQIILLLNPGHIVIDSPFHEVDAFKQSVLSTVDRRALKLPTEKTSILFIKSSYASSVGAAFAVILDFEKE